MSTMKMVNILYAEDEEDIITIAQIALEDIGGFHVEYARNGYEVLEIAQQFVPDLILLDVMMPHMDGPTALKALRSKPKFVNIPAVFMTAKIQPQAIEEYKAIGATCILAKPFSPLSLAEVLTQIWEEYYERIDSKKTGSRP